MCVAVYDAGGNWYACLSSGLGGPEYTLYVPMSGSNKFSTCLRFPKIPIFFFQ